MVEAKMRKGEEKAATPLVPGETCRRVTRADRLSVTVDAADYRDFDLRLEMLPDETRSLK